MHLAVERALMDDGQIAAAVADRVFWGWVPPGTTPAPFVSLQDLGAPRLYHSTGRADLQKTRVQIDIYADGYGDQLSLTSRIEDVLTPLRGVLHGCDIRHVAFDGGRDGEAEIAGVTYFRRTEDVIITWRGT